MAVRSKQEHREINRFLGSHGFPPLEQGGGLMAALGFMVRNHEHFRSLVGRCAPEERSSMYDSLKPYVRFPLHELSWYVARTAEMADAKDLPTLQENGDFKFPSDARATGLCACPEVLGIYFSDDMTPMCRTCRRPLPVSARDQAIAQDAVNWAFSKKSLTLTCRTCTKEESFPGADRFDALVAARNAGWVTYERPDGSRTDICPDCPAERRTAADGRPSLLPVKVS